MDRLTVEDARVALGDEDVGKKSAMFGASTEIWKKFDVRGEEKKQDGAGITVRQNSEKVA